MYQKRALETQHSQAVLERCIHACNSIAAIAGIITDKMQVIGPHNILSLFVATRFLLGTSISLLIYCQELFVNFRAQYTRELCKSNYKQISKP
jgi:hypothetical protein